MFHKVISPMDLQDILSYNCSDYENKPFIIKKTLAHSYNLHLGINILPRKIITIVDFKPTRPFYKQDLYYKLTVSYNMDI